MNTISNIACCVLVFVVGNKHLTQVLYNIYLQHTHEISKYQLLYYKIIFQPQTNYDDIFYII